jgi:hypothetical protein
MSGPAIVRALLVADGAVTAAVPAARIQGGVLPEGIALPAIGVMTVSFIERKTVNTQTKARVTERVQVSVLAADYPTAKGIVPKVRKACRNKRSAAGYTGVLVTLEDEGPDIRAQDTGIYMKSQDFLVTYDETT